MTGETEINALAYRLERADTLEMQQCLRREFSLACDRNTPNLNPAEDPYNA